MFRNMTDLLFLTNLLSTIHYSYLNSRCKVTTKSGYVVFRFCKKNT